MDSQCVKYLKYRIQCDVIFTFVRTYTDLLTPLLGIHILLIRECHKRNFYWKQDGTENNGLEFDLLKTLEGDKTHT